MCFRLQKRLIHGDNTVTVIIGIYGYTVSIFPLDGGVFEGEIVYDLDESEGYEMLNGNLDDMEFNIPFNMIKSITPKGRHSSIVELKNGEKLRLEDSHDVSGDHDGIIIFMGKKDNEYVAWEEVEKVTFK